MTLFYASNKLWEISDRAYNHEIRENPNNEMIFSIESLNEIDYFQDKNNFRIQSTIKTSKPKP